MNDSAFWVPRRCLLEPIPEIWTAAELLQEAMDAHLSGDTHRADALIRQADILAIAEWTESIWGPEDENIHRFRPVPNTRPIVAKAIRAKPRNPTPEMEILLKQRDGYFCRFCGIPVIEKSIREKIRMAYPEALRWRAKNAEQHAAFQCMWLQYDHLLPYSRAGETSLDNLVITCAPCNNGRGERSPEQVGLIDPRQAFTPSSWKGAATWRGLEHFVGKRMPSGEFSDVREIV
jgi:5-methylcytosine-specific restriction endonuclease McrA